MTQKKEKLYKFCVVNDLLVIQAQEIKTIPYCMVRLFADTLSLRANGIVRPVIGLQKILTLREHQNHNISNND